MNSSGYRGRNFGPRGARINGPTNVFNGPRFPHPSFNHPRPPHRLSGPDKWIERANFVPWQQNKNFLPHPQYRGNLQFRPNNRGRTTSHGILRFSGPGRPSTAQFCMGFIRNPIHRPPLLQEEQDEDKPILISQTPLLGSEEERQQKILETADKLKQKLSSITEEELKNFWEDDLSVLPNNSSEEENIRNKGIPELSHEPPELDLTFTDFRDIGRVDCINSKFENVDNKSNNEISISFEQKSTDNVISTNDKITIINENNKGKSLIILDSIYDKDNLLKSDKCYEQIHHDLTNFECNEKNLHFQNNNFVESLISSTSNNMNEKSSNLNENITNLLSIESVNDSLPKKSPNINDIESTTNDDNGLKIDFSQNQNIVQVDTQRINENITQDININIQHNDDYIETKLLENNQIQNNLQTNISQEISHKNLETIYDYSQNRLSNFSSSNEEIYSNITCDSTSATYSNYNDSSIFQSRIFNIPFRFTPRIGGSKCHWTFQQNRKNLFFRESQRLSFHDNQISSPRHVASFKSNDLIPIEFDPRAPPPFMHNIPVSSHEFQKTAIVSFSSNDLPPTFNPNAPPPNIRSKSSIELSQEWLQPVSSLDLRGQAINNTQSNLKIIQSSSAFDPRGPLPRISNIPITINETVSEFNPQQPPPKIHKREETLQPPPIFDPRLSSQERSKLIAPLDISGSNMVPLNLIETSPVSDFKISSVTSNFSQPPPINISSHQTFISNMQMNFQSVISQTGNGQEIIREFSLPLPPRSITEFPSLPPLPKESLVEKNFNSNQNISMDDGLEDMQEAMEFAKRIMNLSEEIKNNDTPSTFSELSLTPSKIPIPNETSSYHSLSIEEINTNTTKKQKKKENKNKKCRQNVIYGPELIFEKQGHITTIDEKQNLQNQNKKTEDILLSNDKIRPKVIFNLNSKTKRIYKPEDWHKISINISDNKEISQQETTQNFNKEKGIYNSRKHYEIRSNQNKNEQKEIKIKKNSVHSASLTNISTHEKSDDISYRYKNYTKDIKKLKAHSSNMITFNNITTQKNQMINPKKESKKQNVPTSESLWKDRVINRFLKMSKNDICNMVNNSSLRKFDIVMRHLVKERRSSLSLELRNTEDEKMKEYDREEFMNQLNAMLDPSTVVGITDLPTEFIHHLSEVLQLDPMPFDIESQNVDNDEIEIINQNENLKINTCEYANEGNLKIQSFTQQPDSQNVHEEKIEDNFLYNNEESIHYSLNTELNLNTSREDTNLSHRSVSNNRNSENVHKKQPLFNETDLDDILSEVTEKTKNLPNASLSIKSEKLIETCTGALSIQRVTKTFDSNIFSQIPNKTEADLDVIFSAGIARVKQLDKNKINLDNLRARKSNSEDRNTFKSERYERWNRKEDPDTFRNLTKEEWEAKYGIANTTISPTIIRKNVFNSDENLTKDKNNCIQRYCSPDLSMRHLSISPLTRKISTYNVDKCISDPNEIEELQNTEGSESSDESSLTSSSDTDEEIVASNVTKLLKIIKEKEKIAKKKSLNETIRDEVAAEIEKKWKEKNKHKERKSRKYGKKKKDKKNKRKREKRKKKKRNYYSDSSKFSEKIERSRLLTKNEIKKEVIIKQEPTKSEENASFNSEINNTMINKVIDLRIESQCLQIEKEQLSTITNTTSQSKNKSVNIPMLMQPKTKAQLKQMPESSNTDQMHIMKKTIEITNNKTNNEKIKDLLDMNKDNEITKNNNEQIDTVSYTNFSLHQIHVSVNKELPSSIQPHVKTISNDTADITSFKSFNYNTLNSVTNLNINNQNVGQKVCTSISSAENKNSGYKKIDIKAYKERALQRRLKEQTISKKNPVNSISFIQESHVLPVNESNIELLDVMKEMKTNETDINELKDPRLRIRSINTSFLEDSDKEIKQKISLKEMDVVQKNEKSLIQLQNPSENNIIHPINSDLNTFQDSIKYKKYRNDNKCSSQIITIREFDEFRKKEKSKFELEKKKSSSTIDFFKFKNIRSEGSKELKLKKEKSKKSAEKKKKDSKSNESRSPIKEKSIEKYSYKKISEYDQESLILNSHTNNQTEIKKINNDVNENLCTIQITETCSKNIEGINDIKTIQEQTNTNSIVKQKNQQSIDNRESVNIDKNVTLQVNKEIITENQQIINQNLIETKDDQSLISLSSGEKNNIKEIEKYATEVNKLHTISTESESLNLSQYLTIENLDIEKNTYSEMSSIGLTFFNHTPSIEKRMENTICLVSNHISKESHPLIEQIDIDIQKNDDSINVKFLKNVETYNESISDTKMDSKTIVKNDGTNEETNNGEEHKDKFIFQLKTSENHNKIVKNEAKSPDSPSSPFKGFYADTICENDICQVSQLCNTKMKTESNKKNVIENSDQLETCFNDRPIIESAKDYRNNTRSFSKKIKKDNEIILINNLVKEKQNIQDKTIDNNNLNMRNEVDIIISKTENTDVSKNKNDRTYNFPPEQKKILCRFNIENHDTFNEDSKTFIVLDEYVDNANEKSIEKFSTLDLDFEDCIARDANIFTNKSLQVEENSMNNIKSSCFDPIIFNKVSESIFDKKDSVNKEQSHNNIISMHEKEKSTLSQKNISFSKKLFAPVERTINITDIVSCTSESNIEESKMPNITEPINSIISDISIECSQNIISTTSKDISQKTEETPESSVIEMRIEKENHNFTIPENNSRHNLESLNAAVTSSENKTSEKLNILTEDTNTPSENCSFIASISETISEKNAEFLVLETQEELDHNSTDQQVLVPFEIKMSNNKNASIDSAIEYEASKSSNKTISKKLNQKKRNIILNNIKNKSRMRLNRCKHKKQKHNISKKIIKEVIKSDTIKITHPTTKADVMARMIEIDVEIHKLMTEKMTLYKMVTTLPNDDNLQQNNVTYENKEVGIPVIKPQTSSMLMSQLIQNIETNPITNQCVKKNKENLSINDIPNNPMQSNRFKALHKYDHYTEKKESCTFNSDDEIAYHIGDIKSLNPVKRKRKKSKKLIKKLENKLNSNISSKDIQNTMTEKIKVNDITHLTSQKINIKQGIIRQDSDQISVNEIKSQEDMNKISIQQIELSNKDKIEMLKSQEIDKIIESTESVERNIQTKIQTLNERNYLKDNEKNIEILSKKNINLDNKNNDEKNIEKSSENKTPERSSIYSDDSTWDSLLQNSSVDDQKKPTTGLALLEETYKKEMAKTRRIKAEARKKKKKKLQNLLQSVNILTPDEEELPLSILYIKKLHQKKKLLDSLEQQMKQQTNHNSQLWKNVVEVINVAKNKTEDLESFEKQSIAGVISHVLNSEKNIESNENKEKQIDLKSRNITEFYTESLINHENKNERNNNSKQNNLQILSDKSQEFLNNKHFQKNLEINVSSKIANDLSEISICDTYMNIKENLAKSCEQQTMKNNNIEINQMNSLEDSNSCLIESNLNNIHNNQNISNTSGNSDIEKIEKKTDKTDMEFYFQKKLVNIEKNITTQEVINNQLIITSEDVEKNYDTLIESNNDKNIIIINEKEKINSKIQNVNEEKLQDNKDNNTIKEFNNIYQDEHFISLKEHKEHNKLSNEENNNQKSISSFIENIEVSKNDIFGKKLCKRKRGNNKTPLRRSSRYAEESAKRIKLEVDICLNKQEEMNSRMSPNTLSVSLSPCEEIKTIFTNSKKNRSIQKPIINRKRCTPMSPEIEILSHESNLNNKSMKAIKKYKKHTMSEMMNCIVRVVDCKHTILNPTISLNLLQKYGISRINTNMYSNSSEIDFLDSMQSTSTKDILTICTKQASLTEFSQTQTSKLIKTFDDTTRSTTDQINLVKIKKISKSIKNSLVNDKEEYINNDTEIMPILIKEPNTMDNIQNYDKPDIEIMEEKMKVIKNQQYNNCESTPTVINMTEDKELLRTQYTVHKGPILDIKVKKKRHHNKTRMK